MRIFPGFWRARFAVGFFSGFAGCAVVAAGEAAYFHEADIFLAAEDIDREYRIPSLVTATDGTLLAFCGRAAEGGGRKVVLRRSFDGGVNWEPEQVVGPGGMGAAIVDESSGDVMVLVGGALVRSRDHGETWEREEWNVLPNLAGHTGTAGGSESGITLAYGEHEGRLLMPVRVRPQQSRERRWWAYHYNTAMFSDDGGRTWQTGEPVQSGTGEGTLAELSDGRIYYNSRSHKSIDDRRRIAVSHDGGATFTEWRTCMELYDGGGYGRGYGCNAGLLRLPLDWTGGDDVLLYSAPDTQGGARERMTVWASFDGGETWPVKRLVYEGPSAYSSLAAGRDGRIHLLYERGREYRYEGLAVATFTLEWLKEGDGR